MTPRGVAERSRTQGRPAHAGKERLGTSYARPRAACKWCRVLSCFPTLSYDHCRGTVSMKPDQSRATDPDPDPDPNLDPAPARPRCVNAGDHRLFDLATSEAMETNARRELTARRFRAVPGTWSSDTIQKALAWLTLPPEICG